MAPKRTSQTKSFPSNPTTKISNLIWDCNIPSSINIRHLTEKGEKIWKTDGLEPSLLVQGKHHIKTLCLPLHPMILQIISIMQIHPMQLTPNSPKCIVATIILNEVEKKGITVEDSCLLTKMLKPLKILKPQPNCF